MSTPNQEKWEEDFEEQCPLAFAGRDWAKSFIRQTLASQKREIVEKLKNRKTNYPKSLFKEPPKGWQTDLDHFCQNQGYRIDNVSAHYARWQEKLVIDDIIKSLTEKGDEL